MLDGGHHLGRLLAEPGVARQHLFHRLQLSAYDLGWPGHITCPGKVQGKQVSGVEDR